MDDGTPWKPEPWQWTREYEGRAVVIIGNGPSLASFSPDAVAGHPLIAINSACRWAQPVAQAADILFFHDNSWNENHPALADAWPGRIVTSNRYAAARLSPRALKLDVTELTLSLSADHGATHSSSGHSAAALAAAMGARRVVLLGFDGGMRAGRSQWHDDYREQDDAVYRERFVPGWNVLVPSLARVGCEVVNATPASSITAAPFMELAAALS